MPERASNSRVGALAEWLGIAGSVSCYLAMFPLALVGMFGLAGVSAVRILPVLSAYMVSPFFNPILILSIALLVISMIPGGLVAIVLSLVAGVAIFVSMNVYMQAWLFLLAFLLLAGAELVSSYRHRGRLSLRDALLSVLPLAIIIVILGLGTYFSPIPPRSSHVLPPSSAQSPGRVPSLPQTTPVMPMQMP